jgi:hypothetical protein
MMKVYSLRLPIRRGRFVKVIKRGSCAAPLAQPCPWDQWIPGVGSEDFSLPVDYELRGILLEPIIVGSCLVVLRFERNGVLALGIFSSTPVQEIHADGRVITENSIYEISKA